MGFYFGTTEGRRLAASARYPMPVMDPSLQFSINEVYSYDGLTIHPKWKTLRKFGKTSDADASTKTTVATLGTGETNETFSTSNDINALVSSSGSDTGSITVEGHTIDASGNLTFVSQECVLTGQTPSSLSFPLARCTRLYRTAGTFASPSVDLVGDVFAFTDSSDVTVTGGVPQTASTIKCRIVAGRQQSEKCATSISQTDYWIVKSVTGTVSRNAGNTVTADFDLEIRRLGGVWLPAGIQMIARADSDPKEIVDLDPYIIVPRNSDVRLVATTNTDNTTVSGSVAGILCEIIP